MGHLSVKRRAFFVTGTDTEVGKTFVTEALLIAL
ncbi:MAG: dethiobiotin synthetase, partial [Gammaproteobacteria bacterium]